MRYGFCTEFATPQKNAADYGLVRRIKEAGYDFIEFRLMLIAGLNDDEFAELSRFLKDIALPCDVCCALFPKTIRLVGAEADRERIRGYLERAFGRASQLGAAKLVFGSAPARELPPGMKWSEGYDALEGMIREIMLPLCERHGFEVVIEPIRSNACNFIHTLADGMELVNRVRSPKIKLLADSLHMLTNNDPAEGITEYFDSIRHVHVSNAGRALPEDSYDSEVLAVLSRLKEKGYDGTISFESNAGREEGSLKEALKNLKSFFK